MNKAALSLVIAALSVSLVANQAAPAPIDCSPAPYGKIFFMPGEWEVVETSSQSLFGFSSIKQESAGGCTIKEELFPEDSSRPLEIMTGFDTKTGAHRQVLSGLAPMNVSMFEVETDDTIAFEGIMYSLGDPSQKRHLRAIYTVLPEGGFRHQAFVSADDGQNWRRTLDLTYRSIRDDE